MEAWLWLNEKVLKHPVISGLLVLAIAGLVGILWSDPLSTNNISVRPGPVATQPLSLPLHSEPTSGATSCESIDRRDEGVLSQSIYDVRARMFQMMDEGRTTLEIDNFFRQFGELWAIDCGYVSDLFRQYDWIVIIFSKDYPEIAPRLRARCFFDGTWEKKIATLGKGQFVKFAGKIFGDDPGLIRLLNCRILNILEKE